MMENCCFVCGETIIGTKYKFERHLFVHNSEKTIFVEPRFRCSVCLKLFFRNDVYKKHLAIHNPEYRQRKTYVCDYCKRAFIDKRSLIHHMNIHDSSIVSPKLMFPCEACGIIYRENRLLKHHIRKTHYNFTYCESVHATKMPNDTWIERVKDSEVCVMMTKLNNNVLTIKKCAKGKDLCQRIEIAKETDLINSNSLQFTYLMDGICHICNKAMLKKSIAKHIREKHLKTYKYECSTCKQTYKRQYQVVNHKCGKPHRRVFI